MKANMARAGVLGIIFIGLWAAVDSGLTHDFDTQWVKLFRDPENAGRLVGPSWMHEMGRDLTAMGSVLVLASITGAVVGCFLLIRKWRLAAFTIFAVGGGAVVSFALKALVSRPRPDLEAVAHVFTSSFPSGHAALSAVTFMTFGALISMIDTSPIMRGYCLVVAGLAIFAVGSSRLYLGLHYPTDVLAGWLVGGAWTMFALGIFDASTDRNSDTTG